MPYPDDVCEQLGMAPLNLQLPNIEKLMNRGVTFHNCITPSPVCAPARACLATGLKYSHSRCMNNGQNTPLDLPTFFQVLREGGYHVGGVGKFDLQKADREFGLDGWVPKHGYYGFEREFTCDNAGKLAACKVATTEYYSWKDNHRLSRNLPDPESYRPADPYINYLDEKGLMHVHIKEQGRRAGPFAMFKTEPVSLSDEDYFDNFVGRNALEMLDSFPPNGQGTLQDNIKNTKTKPWFLWVNFVGPHNPFDVTKRMRDSIEGRAFPAPTNGQEALEDGIVDIRRNYAAAIENIDRNIGLFIEKLEERGELDNTIIIYASDHGEMLGDCNRWHKSVPYRSATRVPLVLAGLGIGQDIISSQLVELQDLAATIVDFAGLEMPCAKQSISLRPLLEHPDNAHVHREYQTSALIPNPERAWTMISDGTYKLVCHKDRRRLFNLASDPWELHDVAGEHPEIVQDLQQKLRATYQGTTFWDILPQ